MRQSREAEIQAALACACMKTVLEIAHRLSTIEEADQISSSLKMDVLQNVAPMRKAYSHSGPTMTFIEARSRI